MPAPFVMSVVMSRILVVSLASLTACIVPNPFAGAEGGDAETGTSDATDSNTTQGESSTDTLEDCEPGEYVILADACPSNPTWRLLGVCEEAGAVATPYCVDPLLPSCDAAAAPYGGGSGAASDPYLLCTAAHVHAVAQEPGASFVLVRAVDLGALVGADAFAYVAGTFTGSLDGRGHVLAADLDQGVLDQGGASLFDSIEAGASVGALNLVGRFRSVDGGSMLASRVAGRLESIYANVGLSSAGDHSAGLVRSVEAGGALADVRGYGELEFTEFGGGLVDTLAGQAERLRFDGSVSGVRKIAGVASSISGEGQLAQAHALAAISVSGDRGGCVAATVSEAGRIEDSLCDGSLDGTYVSGMAVEPYMCAPNCEMHRVLVRADYVMGSNNTGGETTSLGVGWLGSVAVLVDLPPNVHTEFGVHLAADEVTPGNPALDVLEQQAAWAFVDGELGLTWDAGGASTCAPTGAPRIACGDAFDGLQLCLPGGVEVVDCIIDAL